MAIALLIVSVVPFVLGISVGGGVPIEIITEDFEPRVFQCDSRVVFDDATEPGRFSEDGEELLERINTMLLKVNRSNGKLLYLIKTELRKL